MIKKEQEKLDKVFAKNLVVLMKKKIFDILYNKGDHIYYQLIRI